MPKFLLLGEPAYARYADELRLRGYAPVSLPPDPRLNPIVASHADTLIFECIGRLVMNSEYLSRLALPDRLRERIEPSEDFPFGDYPNDVRFNALALNGRLYARAASLSPDVKALAIKSGFVPVNVRQGYVRCSVLAVPPLNLAVTSDIGLADSLESDGVRVLRIAPGGIELPGCEYGFIGGASFADAPQCCCSLHSRPTVYFFGSLAFHPEGARIRSFLEGGGCEVVELPGRLTDFGGGIVV